MLPVLILAGGLATRLRPLTERIPKALVPVANKPFVIHQLEFLKGQGIRKVILCTGYRADQIKVVVGDGSAYGLEVSYSEEGDTPLWDSYWWFAVILTLLTIEWGLRKRAGLL